MAKKDGVTVERLVPMGAEETARVERASIRGGVSKKKSPMKSVIIRTSPAEPIKVPYAQEPSSGEGALAKAGTSLSRPRSPIRTRTSRTQKAEKEKDVAKREPPTRWVGAIDSSGRWSYKDRQWATKRKSGQAEVSHVDLIDSEEEGPSKKVT